MYLQLCTESTYMYLIGWRTLHLCKRRVFPNHFVYFFMGEKEIIKAVIFFSLKDIIHVRRWVLKHMGFVPFWGGGGVMGLRSAY